METVSIRKTLVSIEDAASIFGIEPALLKTATKKNMGVLSVSEASELLNINKESLYAASSKARYNKFPRAVVPKINPTTGLPSGRSGKISILHKDFLEWVIVYKSNKNQELIQVKCKRASCNNLVDSRRKQFCNRNCFVGYRLDNDEYRRMGTAGHEGKGRKERFATGNSTLKVLSEKSALKRVSPGTKVMTIFI